MGGGYREEGERGVIPELKGYAFFYFVCEGTNEEHIPHWMDEEQALCIEKDCYSLEFCRCRSKKGRQELARQIKEMDYDGPVAVIYICDSAKEEWKLPKREIGTDIPIIHVVTKQGIEILLILSDEKAYKAWLSGKKNTMKASAFARGYFTTDVKNGEIFRERFEDFGQLVEACRKYKSQSGNNDGCPCLYDLLDERYTGK